MTLRLYYLIIFFALSPSWSFGATVNEKIYIVRDSIELVSGDKIPYFTFNTSDVYTSTNARIELFQLDILDLWVVNTDSVAHDFEIKNLSSIYSIPAEDSINVVQAFNESGVFVYHDPSLSINYNYLGLSGMIAVKDNVHASFFWNLKDHRSNWNVDITNYSSVDWSTYYPDFFTINGVSSPAINLDPSARIVGNVGDTLMVYITNTGRSIHALHFHGFHVQVMYSSKNANHVGRIKDSQGVYPGEGVVLRLVPDKPGEYPVHDHNLIATTGGNVYPFGMFTTMLISE